MGSVVFALEDEGVVEEGLLAVGAAIVVLGRAADGAAEGGSDDGAGCAPDLAPPKETLD